MSLLNKELTLKIRPLILKGDKYIDIQKELDIKAGTWDYWYWDNTIIENHHQGFRDFVKSIKYERMMKKVEDNLEDFLYMDDKNDNDKIDPQLAKLRQKTTEFVAERIGKIDYSTRTENINDTKLTVEELPAERKEQIRKALRD